MLWTPSLNQRVSAYAQSRGWGKREHDEHTQIEKGHGRIEKHRTLVTWDVPWLIKASSDWKGLRGIVMVEREHTLAETTTIHRHYYITRLDLAWLTLPHFHGRWPFVQVARPIPPSPPRRAFEPPNS